MHTGHLFCSLGLFFFCSRSLCTTVYLFLPYFFFLFTTPANRQSGQSAIRLDISVISTVWTRLTRNPFDGEGTWFFFFKRDIRRYSMFSVLLLESLEEDLRGTSPRLTPSETIWREPQRPATICSGLLRKSFAGSHLKKVCRTVPVGLDINIPFVAQKFARYWPIHVGF